MTTEHATAELLSSIPWKPSSSSIVTSSVTAATSTEATPRVCSPCSSASKVLDIEQQRSVPDGEINALKERESERKVTLQQDKLKALLENFGGNSNPSDLLEEEQQHKQQCLQCLRKDRVIAKQQKEIQELRRQLREAHGMPDEDEGDDHDNAIDGVEQKQDTVHSTPRTEPGKKKYWSGPKTPPLQVPLQIVCEDNTLSVHSDLSHSPGQTPTTLRQTKNRVSPTKSHRSSYRRSAEADDSSTRHPHVARRPLHHKKEEEPQKGQEEKRKRKEPQQEEPPEESQQEPEQPQQGQGQPQPQPQQRKKSTEWVDKMEWIMEGGYRVGWYTGFMVNGLPHGTNGKLTFVNGDVYEGPFREGEMHGSKGRYQWESGGDVYKGEFWHNLRHGFGEHFLKGGKIKQYEGDYQRGKAHGYGTQFNPDGTIAYEGQWEQGSPVKESKQAKKKNKNTSSAQTVPNKSRGRSRGNSTRSAVSGHQPERQKHRARSTSSTASGSYYLYKSQYDAYEEYEHYYGMDTGFHNHTSSAFTEVQPLY